MSRRRNSLGYRWSVASRVLAASFGGYGLVSLLAAALALSLPMPRFEAVITAIMVSFVVYAAVIMGVFHARSAIRAWVWLAASALPLALLVWLLLPGARA